VRRAAKTPVTGDKIDAPAACAVPFRPYCGCVVMRTQNVSEYMLVLALCLVNCSPVQLCDRWRHLEASPGLKVGWTMSVAAVEWLKGTMGSRVFTMDGVWGVGYALPRENPDFPKWCVLVHFFCDINSIRLNLKL